MRFTYLNIILFVLCNCYAQKNDTLNSIILDEIIINSQRYEKPKREITQQIESISKKEIEFQNFLNSADVLGNSGTLAVQKSQQGGGSPVIRGFEASRILILVDGVRMNNLIYRSGHLQNAITVDKNIIEKVDVFFGPSSTIFGSDALGGAISFQTKKPKLLSENNNQKLAIDFISNFNSVNNGKSIHSDFNVAGQKWAAITSISYNDFGDLRMGKRKNGDNDYFGERLFYIETINGIDKQVTNPNKYIQKFSGYKQYDLMQKILYKPSKTMQHLLNFQFSNSSEIPRYDRLTDLNSNGNLRSAEWKYGPQKRILTSYNITKKKALINYDMNLNFSFQNIEESRINRNFDNDNENTRIEKVNVYAINSDFKKNINSSDICFGVDIYYDLLNSSGFKKNRFTNLKSTLDTRYPDGENNSFKGEGFVLFSNHLTKKTSFNSSIRAGYSILNSEIKTNFLNLPYSKIVQKNFIYSGAMGIANNPTRDIKVAFNLATAFRVPNIDDLSKIFESASGILIVPNKDLKPEKTITADLTITFWKGSQFQFENTFYITKLFDQIVTDTFTFNGQSTLIYEGENSTIFANQNKGNGTISGYFSSLKCYITKSILFYGTFNFTHGRINNNSGNVPLDHIPPFYGKTGIKYESKSIDLDFYVLYNGKKDLKDYSSSGEDNLQYATKKGSLAWQTYNIKSSFLLFKELTIFSGIENILDIQYRNFASGINAAGRNMYLGGKYSF